jgi:hypothetical protein
VARASSPGHDRAFHKTPAPPITRFPARHEPEGSEPLDEVTGFVAWNSPRLAGNPRSYR